MPDSFSLARSRCDVSFDPALRDEIFTHTRSNQETSSILRSIDRFGGDASIERYEMTPKPQTRAHRAANTVAWTVHAVRR